MANTHQTLSKKERNRIDREVEQEDLDSEAIDRAARELIRKNKSQKKGSPKLEHRRKVTTTVKEVVTNKKGKKYTRPRDKVTYGDVLPDTPVRMDIGYAGEPRRTHGFRSKGDAEQTLSELRTNQNRSDDSILLVVPDDEAWFKPMGEPDTAPTLSDDEYLAEVHFNATHAPGRRMRYIAGASLRACYTHTESGTECTHDRQKGRLVEVSEDTPAIDSQGNRYRTCMTLEESYKEVSRMKKFKKEAEARAKKLSA